MTHDETKRLYLQYRDRARELYSRGALFHGEQHDTNEIGESVTVGVHAHVQLCEDGAFVEAIVWVPVSKQERPS